MADYKAGFIVLVFGLIGFIIALIEQQAYENSYMLDQFLTDASQLPGLQIITIIIALLMGGILAAVTQG